MAKRCCSLGLCAVIAAARTSDPLCARSESEEEGLEQGAQGSTLDSLEKGVAAAGVAAGTSMRPSTRSTVSVFTCVGGRGGRSV